MRHQKLMRGGWVGEQTRRCERQAKRRTPQLVAPRFTPGASVVSASPPPPGELRLVGQDHSLPPAMFLTLYRIVGSRDRAGARNKTAWRECSRWQSNNGGGGEGGEGGGRGGADSTTQGRESAFEQTDLSNCTYESNATSSTPSDRRSPHEQKKRLCLSLTTAPPCARTASSPPHPPRVT